jgi:mannose-1-phosphate guanylyltransferase
MIRVYQKRLIIIAMQHALILAGGSGTRLWPYSTAGKPKQLVPLFGGKSLLALAFERALAVVPLENIWLVANPALIAAARQVLPELHPERCVAEPSGRNTLPAVALGVEAIHRADPEAAVAVLTSDHLIEPVADFAAVMARGFERVAREPQTLVTFGVRPTFANTGYGYLRLDGAAGADGARAVAEFREKPPQVQADAFFAAGPETYLWNSGMFVWKASSFLAAAKRHAPDLSAAGWDERPKVSVDVGVMEPVSREAASPWRILALPLDLHWLDVGTWPSYAEALAKGPDGNAVGAAKAVIRDSRGCLVASTDPNHLVAVLGCENLVVVHTPQATLVCPAARAQEVRDLQAQIAREAPELG